MCPDSANPQAAKGLPGKEESAVVRESDIFRYADSVDGDEWRRVCGFYC